MDKNDKRGFLKEALKHPSVSFQITNETRAFELPTHWAEAAYFGRKIPDYARGNRTGVYGLEYPLQHFCDVRFGGHAYHCCLFYNSEYDVLVWGMAPVIEEIRQEIDALPKEKYDPFIRPDKRKSTTPHICYGNRLSLRREIWPGRFGKDNVYITIHCGSFEAYSAWVECSELRALVLKAVESYPEVRFESFGPSFRFDADGSVEVRISEIDSLYGGVISVSTTELISAVYAITEQ